jgi:DNA repair protein RecN (Recombination protein N)
VRALARLDGRWEPLATRLAGLEAEVEDASQEVRTLGDAVEHDPAALARLEDRLGEIHRLLRRYGDDEAAVLAHAGHASAEAARLRGMEGEREARTADDARLLREISEAGAALSALRRLAAVRLAHAASLVLADIGFPADSFGISVQPRPGAGEWVVLVDGDAVGFDAAGLDSVVYTFRPNAGEPRRPLAKIASGGELSRVGLAVQQVLARVDKTPTLVFDEIDSGIGGRSADPVGKSLWTLARTHQVLCVTHLPQIAAYADAHYRIAKHERDGRTVTEVVRLDDAGREGELAAMLGGMAGGDAARLSARELLDRARRWAGDRGATDTTPAAG